MIKIKRTKNHRRYKQIIMGSKANNSSNQKTFIFSLLFLSLTLLVFTVLSLRDPNKPTNYRTTTIKYFSTTRRLHKDNDQNHDAYSTIPVTKPYPQWLMTIIEEKLMIEKKKNNNTYNYEKNNTIGTIKVGLVNVDRYDGGLHGRPEGVEIVPVKFDSLSESNIKWEELFPEWIDEKEKWAPPTCPEVPLPSSSVAEYDELDVVVAKVPCGINTTRMDRGVRDVVRLQLNLVAANLAVRSSRMGHTGGAHKRVYVVFVGSCGPMVEIFRCDDLLRHKRGEYWLYRPDMTRLMHKVLMPVGSCQLASPYAQTGEEVWRSPMSQTTTTTKHQETNHTATQPHPRAPRYAYATILHSSESYVCGAIALAHSIRRANSSARHDLVLMADTSSLGPRSLTSLRSAGWKIFPIQRIRSPFAAKGSYNEWNYSKLRVFQLTRYQKIVFIDADLVVLKNLDFLFRLPPLSAAPNDKTLFNSGLMVVEPSQCLFEDLMRKSFEVKSYNGGDQGFLNEVFTWWHRLPARTNYMKVYGGPDSREVPGDVAAVHFLGLKPWACYRDYDCNWDMMDHHLFASDSAHGKWWEVYDSMPRRLQRYCGLTRKMDWRIRKWRKIAENKNLSDGHWRILPNDPRRHFFVD